ncbi:MAG TPA: DUF1343 domain-containing protein [Candidatus Acidoferrales bacterium]|jgi:uncharacterized protein YbbC (DUF1343 family)|nr:DUF1343 domain-containing protein [Candidatus Acidoferrales bacterium]
MKPLSYYYYFQTVRAVSSHLPMPLPILEKFFYKKSFLSLLILSVFICVNPWFQSSELSAQTMTGINVLETQKFAALAGKHVGLITNQTGVDRDGRSTIDLLAHARGVKLVALFSPEHGIRGALDARVSSSTDEATGLPIYSLYGETDRPTDAMLAGLDALVFDIQDAGVRFYTYITTMGYAMEAAAAHHISFYVLDRPDPLGGDRIEGPMLDPDRTNFVGYFPMPVRMGMTLGEMAQMFNVEKKIDGDLHIIRMKNWRRNMWFHDAGLRWVNPSPNLRSEESGVLYPGLEILQAGGVSVGRGTETPFEIVGAPWIRGEELARYLNNQKIPGVRFEPRKFTPDSGLFKGGACEGVHVLLVDRNALQSMRMGIELAAALAKLYPGKFEATKIITLVGNVETIKQLQEGRDPAAIVNSWTFDLESFRKMRAKYLLYP